MELSLILPGEVRKAWPLILPSLHAVMSKGPVSWIPEDVYHELRTGSAACHVATDAGQYAGCMVTQRVVDDYSGEPALHVWIAHNAGTAEVLDAGLPLLRDMARKGGFARITFGSSRPGWAKRYKMIQATYEIPMESP